MKNCIEHPDHLLPEFTHFSSRSKGKLAKQLSGESVESMSLTEEDLCLFSLASKRLGIPDLQQICNQARDKKASSHGRQGGCERRRTVSENVMEPPSHAMVRRRVSSPSLSRRNDKQSYLLLFGEARGKTSVIVIRLGNGSIFQKVVHTGEIPEHLKCVGCGYDDDAPFLYFLHCDSKNHVDLKPYDVLECKMKSRVRLTDRCEISHVISTGSFMACFRRNSDTVEMFNINKKKWAEPLKLQHPVNMPVLVSYGENVYIFSGSLVQCYEPAIGRVTASPISEFVSTGYAFAFEGRLNIISDNSRIEYDVITGHCRRIDFPYLGYQPIHAAFVRNGVAFALITNKAGKYELLWSHDLEHWTRVHSLSFPKRLHLVNAEVVDFAYSCPVSPFQTFDESLKSQKFTLS